MKKSKTFLSRRQSEVEIRLDRKWQPERSRPVLESGNVRYEVSGRSQAVGCGGLGMIQSVVKSTGLAALIDAKVEVLKRHRPYHESDHVLALAYNLLVGGQCIDDLDRHRRSVAFLDALGARRIPGATTAGDFLRRFDAESIRGLMDASLRASANVWHLRPASERALAVIDVDGTLVPTTGVCKEHMDIAYTGCWGFHPLVVSLANSQEVLAVVNRPGNRPSHDGAAAWMDRAIQWSKEQAGFSKARLRGDTDFSLTTNFDRWHADRVEFVFGMDANRGFVQRAKGVVDTDWMPLARPTRPIKRQRPENVKQQVVTQRGFKKLALVEERVAEIAYSPGRAKGTYRLVILRKRIRVTKGQLALEDETRYFFYITNIPAEAMSAADVIRENNARCHQENLIEQLKNGVRATRMPVAEFDANWAYLVIGALAWNLKAWAGMLLPKEMGARALIKMEFRRFLDQVMLVPALIIRTGRRLVFRLLEVNRWTSLLLEGTHRLKKRRFA